MNHFPLRYSFLALSLCLCYQNVQAQQVEFDNSFLFGQQTKQIDLQNIVQSDKVAEGEYLLDIFLNNRYITRSKVFISNDPQDPTKQRYCIPRNTVKQIDFSPKLIDLNRVESDCIDTRVMNHVVFWKLNMAEQRVDIQSPQAMLNERPYGYISPSLWEDGANSGFLKYYYNYYNSKFGDDRAKDSDYLNLNAGINLDDWQFRHSGSTRLTGEGEKQYISNENKLMHVLPTLNAQLTLGDFYSNTQSLNTNSSFSIRGLQIASDDRMLPISQQSYAPAITGYAKTNALVKIKQNQQVILEKTVPAGAFNIKDLLTPGVSGTLTVEIIEANGEIRSFNLPYNNFIQSIRKDQSRYQMALGQYREYNQAFDEKVFNASLDYGLSNLVSLSGSTLLSDHYRSYTLGTGLNTSLGGLALEGNFISADLKNQSATLDSALFNLRYNFAFNQMRSFIQLNHSHYSNDEYYSFNEVMQNHYQTDNDNSLVLNGRPKSSNFVQFTQNLGDQWGSLALNYSQYNFWNNAKTQNFYQISYNNSFKGITYYFGVQRTNSSVQNNNSDTQYFVNVDIPLSFTKSNTHLHLNSELYPEQSSENSHQIGLFGNLGDNNQFSYGLNYINAQDNDQLSSSMSYRSSPVYVSSTYTTDFDKQRQYSVQLQGAMVAHRHGLTLTNDLNDTFAIVHAKGLEGVKLQNGYNLKLDAWGNAVIPSLSPYQYNSIGLNSDSIPVDTEVDATQIQVVPKSNSSVLIDFKASKSSKALISLQYGNVAIPMGTQVFDSNEHAIAMLGQGQQVFLSNLGIRPYTLRWGESETCQFQLTDDILKQAEKTLPFANVTVTCQ